MKRRVRHDMEARELAHAEAEGPDRVPPTPRPAAGVILARDSSEGPEVLLVHRRSDVRFAAGAHVFPGGTVDEEDGDDAWARWLVEPRPDAIAGAADPGGPVARAFLVAALREMFEETGVLLSVDGPLPIGDLAEDRAGLVQGRRRFMDIVADREIRLASDRLVLCARWITPEALSRRYDARFFLAEAPADIEVVPESSELVDYMWIRPGEAVERYFERRIDMLFPTVTTLSWLEEGENVAEWFARFRATEIKTIMPRLRHVDGHLTSILPGEPGYDDREDDG